jgi:hypothetical protein
MWHLQSSRSESVDADATTVPQLPLYQIDRDSATGG